MEDTVSKRTKGDEGDPSYHIRKRNPCKVEGITELEVSHSDQVDRVPTEIQRTGPIDAESCEG